MKDNIQNNSAMLALIAALPVVTVVQRDTHEPYSEKRTRAFPGSLYVSQEAPLELLTPEQARAVLSGSQHYPWWLDIGEFPS
ncbi:hypothetical protein ACDQ55_18805 [Chitinophaga sp. 30R24]|uniref:hypothetical protein n=1 Tax=Chitinophaga sp. 30R24 TaxID=3248838 RepID=UPI003B91794E